MDDRLTGLDPVGYPYFVPTGLAVRRVVRVLPILRTYGTDAHTIEMRSTDIASLRDLPAALITRHPV